MLTRLKVSGFKNLVDVDVRFGAFTCIAGANGVGKSNLFDAIRFLSALASHSLVEAAQLVRDEDGRSGDIRSLFHRVGDRHVREMMFEAEMIVPKQGSDHLGQPASARGTFIQYRLKLGWFEGMENTALELLSEDMQYVTLLKSDIRNHLLFPHNQEWRDSVIEQIKRGRDAPFISTDVENGRTIIKQHYDGTSGRPFLRDASKLPRTVLSALTAAESATVVVARQEMQSWRLMQLEPSSLRKPDDYSAPARISVDGSHLAAALSRLSRAKHHEETLYQEVANHLGDLLDDVSAVRLDRDDKKEVVTLLVRAKDGTWHPARSLSDGTLRFLALTVMSLDPEMNGLICLEEPENGIHPQRIPAVIELMRRIAVDPESPVDDDNPLRQIIINTHSPLVVQQIPDDSLLYADLVERYDETLGYYKGVRFSALPDTWRTSAAGCAAVAKGDILAYINPVVNGEDEIAVNSNGIAPERRVIDREDVQQLLLPLTWERQN